MIDYLSNLPAELIHKIFDDITTFYILGCLSFVNKRLRLISFDYPRFRLDLNSIKRKKQFDVFCDQLTSISSQVVSLSLSDQNDGTIPAKIEIVFSRFEFINVTFSNLSSLHLSHVDHLMWKSIKHHIKLLTSFVSIFIVLAHLRFGDEVGDFTSYLLKDLLFISTSLKYVYVKPDNVFVHTAYLDFREEKVSSIEYFTLLSVPTDLEKLCSVVPALRTLNIKAMIYHPAHKFCLNLFENLRRLSLTIYHLYFSTIEQLLYPMRKLVDLILIANNVYYDMCDGAAWERILAEIISFKFLFRFHKTTWSKDPIKLDSFRSLFWLEKKRWYVGYDRCTVSGFSLLYSIPYFMNAYPWHSMKGDIDTISTGLQVLSLNNVNCFTVNEQLPTNYKYLRRMTNLQRLAIDESDKIFNVYFHNILPHIDISRIVTLFIAEGRSKIDINSFVRFIFSMPHLRTISASIIYIKYLFFSRWPNIRRVEILCSWPTNTITERRLTLSEIDAFYLSFTHIEYLSFHQDVDLNPSILLNNIPTTISNIVVYHPVNITHADFQDFVTPDWLEQNTRLRDFYYSCSKLNTVSLWF
ncbi:unnamed protein product [Rotaria sp. Silwood2]|nr:unnamed protein product [Rotaria sp. Silwood2]